MGKEYNSELIALPSTIQWARALDLAPFTHVTARLRGGDLVVLASGGSLSAAHLLAQLHMSRTERVATVMTPLEFAMEDHPLGATVLFVSASGSNHDILQAWAFAQRRGCRELVVVCGSPTSRLVELARQDGAKGIIAFPLPTGSDGFLATNSLVTFFCLFLRLYDVDIPEICSLPDVTDFEPLLDREELVVVYGGWLKPVAIDLESRFVEAALRPVLVADYRNFAHGRHHWLAKRGDRTAVLAFIAPRFEALAEDTLSALPRGIIVRRWACASDSPIEALHALLVSLLLAQRAALRLGYDAGRPGVPEFGERIYGLRTNVSAGKSHGATSAAIARKILVLGAATIERRQDFSEQCEAFQQRLKDSKLGGVILDYDGTVVDTAKRFQPITTQMADTLNRVLDEGLLIGIATGRGKSVHKELNTAIASRHHERCYVGYYNGAVIRTLSDGILELSEGETDSVLGQAAMVLMSAHRLRGVAEIEVRPSQVTVTCKSLSELDLWLVIKELLEQANIHVKVVRSSHSVDVLPRHVSKRNVVEALARTTGNDESAFLKIGDRGRWPGNDSELLSMSHGLSVDEVSVDAKTCWNLLPFGLSGVEATLSYLDRVRNARYGEG